MKILIIIYLLFCTTLVIADEIKVIDNSTIEQTETVVTRIDINDKIKELKDLQAQEDVYNEKAKEMESAINAVYEDLKKYKTAGAEVTTDLPTDVPQDVNWQEISPDTSSVNWSTQ